MASTLQDLRKRAGYRTAREFAEAVGIPLPTYSRYEQQPAKIPLDRAWFLADALGTSIDEVVGREAVPGSSVQRRYAALSSGSRSLVDEFIGWAEARDGQEAAAVKAAEESRYLKLAIAYERLYLDELAADPDFSALLAAVCPAQGVEAFRAFVERKLSEGVEPELARLAAARREELALEAARRHADAAGDLFISQVGAPLDEAAETELARWREDKRRELMERNERSAREIAHAYARLQNPGSVATEYDSSR